MSETPFDPPHLLARFWAELAGSASLLENVDFEGPPAALPSAYAVGELAAAQVAAATLAVAELHAARCGEAVRRVKINGGHVGAAFRSERHLAAVGWTLPPLWDPIAGDYRARDGWIRLHTNYAYHREAVLRVLDTPPEREATARAVGTWYREDLETAVVEAGGCAAAMRDSQSWASHVQGRAVAQEPLIGVEPGAPASGSLPAASDRPLGGVRVLDLTRVISGPVCTRVLAAYGADVLRVDPPGFEEVGALLGDTTGGKRSTALDLRREDDRRAFDRLVAGAHVLVHGYRGGALEQLGYSEAGLRAIHPSLVIATLDAYGWTGPWRHRRGFDSLVQMSSGIAARGQELAKSDAPVPLPAQALDHGTGYLLAAAVCRALVRQRECGRPDVLRLSLARVARWLVDIGEREHPDDASSPSDNAATWVEEVDSAWGRLRRVRCPGRIEGIPAFWMRPPGPLGTDAPVWDGD